MSRPPDATVVRFDRTERNVHWWTAALVGACAATALALSVSPVATLVGRRALVRDVHVVAGLLIPVPILVGRLGPWAGRLRRTLRELDVFDVDDRRWLRTLGRDQRVVSGKFHPLQKLNASLVGGALVLLFVTGLVLRWFEPFPLTIRRGSTFVHDWTAFLLAFDLMVHVALAFADPTALRAMVTGRVSSRWAARVHPRWRA